MFGRFQLLPHLWRSARLTLRLLRDSRVPLYAKMIFYAAAIYIISPLDFVPDWIPGFGQADDLVAILAGLNLFFRACPSWIVDEHEADLSGELQEGARSDRPSDSTGTSGQIVDGEFQRTA